MNSASVNPYASPQILSDRVTEGVYFGTATKKLSFREYWWMAKNPAEFVLGVLFKILRVNLPPVFGIAHARFLEVLTPEQLPGRARDLLAPKVSQARELGFEHCLIYTIPHLGPIGGFAVAMLSGDGTVLLGIAYAHSAVGGIQQEVCKFFFGSFLQDGRVVSTLGGKPDLESPPEVLRQSLRGRSMTEVLERHRERLREINSPAIVIRDHAEAERLIRHREERTFDFQCERGVFVALSEVDTKRIMGNSSTPQPVTASAGGGWIGNLSWLILALGLLFFFQGPAANQTQWLFRVAILAVGVLGVIASAILGRRKSTLD